MRKIEFEQGSDEWLRWRKGLLTSTDAPMLMGASPYATPYKGWQRKVGYAEEQEVNFAMLRGQRDEPIARAMFIEKYGINMTPCCIESEQYNFIGASLDGISDCGKYLIEIKSQNVDKIKASGIPPFHMMQIQHQLLATDNTAEKCFYTTIWQDEIYTLEVEPDAAWMKSYLEKALEFWKNVIFFEPPQLCDKDYKDMSEVPSWYAFATEYKKLSSQIKVLEEMRENCKKEIIKLCKDDNCYGSGIKVLKKLVKGRVDYTQIEELSDINLERYRKPASNCWTIMLDR